MKRTDWLIWGLLVIFGFFQFASAQSVSKALLKQDLAYIVETVSDVHPALVEAEMQQALTARAASLVRALPDKVPRWRVGVTVAELLRVLDDAHTTTDMTFGSSRYLPLQFAWLSDGLVVAPVTGSKVAIPVASEVLKVGELDTAVLENRLSRLVSENRYWAREMGADTLPAESVLRWLGVVKDDAVTLMLRTSSGKAKTVDVGLTSYGSGASQNLWERLLEARGLSGPWQIENDVFAWRVDGHGNYAQFWIKTFEDTPAYRAEVHNFFQALDAASVENLVLSVQQNGGGNSRAMYAFLEHLPTRKLRSFSSDLRYSADVLQNLGITQTQFDEAVRTREAKKAQVSGNVYRTDSLDEVIPKKSPQFIREMYIVTDAASFSSSTMTATVFRDNETARLVGEPTGGRPTAYGEVLNYSSPSLEIPIWVSTKYWTRPDPTRDPADTLAPDIPLPVPLKTCRQVTVL